MIIINCIIVNFQQVLSLLYLLQMQLTRKEGTTLAQQAEMSHCKGIARLNILYKSYILAEF
ncbi:hypothetical protein SAMN04488132_104116 [Sediminibacterium ginsengisoli]|uniref:Uncharacterized protein n=1 Tax=Sediminibacterium ginsengisoli TaxID=413434 RepID=A0A1T4N6U3_9BACT|nr:hypothetical protein SAMN04488132_104116 [Sediminibacterium ginsengisoli]